LWNQPVDRIYLRFNVSGLPAGSVSRAIVRLTTTSAVNAGSDSGGEIHTVSAPWDELTLTHLTKPALDATVLSSVAGPIVPSQTIDYDVSGVVTGNGTYDFGLKTLSTDRAEFVSREGGAGAPQLIIFRDAPTSTNPIVHITAPADGTVVGAGAANGLTATATDPQDGNISSSLRRRSDIDGPIGTGPSFTKRLSAGTHTITASVTDSDHNTGSASITFQVTSTRVGYEDFSYGPSIEVQLDKATATKSQSKLWYVDGIWWS